MLLFHCYGSAHQRRFFSLIFLNVCFTSLDSMVKKPVCVQQKATYAFSSETYCKPLNAIKLDVGDLDFVFSVHFWLITSYVYKGTISHISCLVLQTCLLESAVNQWWLCHKYHFPSPISRAFWLLSIHSHSHYQTVNCNTGPTSVTILDMGYEMSIYREAFSGSNGSHSGWIL